MTRKFATTVAAALLTVSALPAQAAFIVSYEAPGVTSSTQVPGTPAVETFDTAPLGLGITYTSTFGGSPFTGLFTGLNVVPADQYGGAGGTGQYAEAGYPSGATPGYSVALSGGSGSFTYFGFYLSALSGGNVLTLTKSGTTVFTLDTATVTLALRGNRAYFGNPDAPFTGQDGGEIFAFVNIKATGGDSFDGLTINQGSGGGFETDNFTLASAVPEPATWAMLLTGIGMAGLGVRRRRAALSA